MVRAGRRANDNADLGDSPRVFARDSRHEGGADSQVRVLQGPCEGASGATSRRHRACPAPLCPAPAQPGPAGVCLTPHTRSRHAHASSQALQLGDMVQIILPGFTGADVTKQQHVKACAKGDAKRITALRKPKTAFERPVPALGTSWWFFQLPWPS